MEALDLFVLGRRLIKIAEEAMRGTGRGDGPRGEWLVLRDVFAHPESSVSEVTARTGLPQSYVSESIASLREKGIVEVVVDPADRRRTLARVATKHRRTVAAKGKAAVDDALIEALGDPGAVAVLEGFAERLRPAQPGPILRQIRDADAGGC